MADSIQLRLYCGQVDNVKSHFRYVHPHVAENSTTATNAHSCQKDLHTISCIDFLKF